MTAARGAQRKGIGKSLVLGGAFALVMGGLIWYASVSLGGHRCEVCLTYGGGHSCRSAEGATLEEARRTALDLACAELASGMTESLRCQNTPPTRVTCDP
ncbi:MAG TPA: hypothetical protein VFW45_05495 [Candidatus Polarisedimenticolia bacterium]|nr:hypothetical protein [Candidatus Polarisedimenticolia bacterium]